MHSYHSYPCEGEVHQVRISKGRIRFVHYDDAHRARDVVRKLRGEPVSTCLQAQEAIRGESPAPSSFARLLSNELTQKRFSRAKCVELPARPFTKSAVRLQQARFRFLCKALSHELARVTGIDVSEAAEYIAYCSRSTSLYLAVVSGQELGCEDFWRCRAHFLGRFSADLRHTMGFQIGDLLYVPAVVEHDVIHKTVYITIPY
jgi:hypothetical protein